MCDTGRMAQTGMRRLLALPTEHGYGQSWPSAISGTNTSSGRGLCSRQPIGGSCFCPRVAEALIHRGDLNGLGCGQTSPSKIEFVTFFDTREDAEAAVAKGGLQLSRHAG